MFELYRDEISEAPEAVAAFARAVSVTFLTAWTQRYGGYARGWTAKGSLVSPPLEATAETDK